MAQYPLILKDANRLLPRLVIAGSILVGLLACSTDSLWIDEASMAVLASEKDLTEWWRRMQEISGSTLQMPLYALYLWLWEKLAGHSEWSLRAANIPFFVLGQWALFRSNRHQRRVAIWFVVIAAASPFIWSYLAEARPYLMQYGSACLVLGGLIQLSLGRPFQTRDLILFCIGLVLLCGTSTLAFPWAGMAMISAVILLRKDKAWWRFEAGHRTALALTALLLSVIFAYDIWAFRSGGKAPALGGTSFQNLLFAAYELLGFAGLGPERLLLRDSQSPAALGPYWLALGAVTLTVFLALAQLRKVPGPPWKTVFLYSVIPLTVVMLFATVAPFRLLGRHVTPIAPVLFLLLAYAAAHPAKWWSNRIFIAVWLVSALTLRMHPRHHRDDYRNAAAAARAALEKGEQVWWAADRAGAEYYKVPLTEADNPNFAWAAANRGDLEGRRRPETVIFSKPDIYDVSGALQIFLNANHYQVAHTLPAFTIWSRTHPDSE